MGETIKVFYNKKMVAKAIDSESPSSEKPRLVVQSWKKLGLALEMMPVRVSQLNELCLAHDPSYVKGILNCTLKNGFGNKDKALAASFPWAVGSFVTAALYAYQSKESVFSPTSGFHHAKFNAAEGFCTFNGLVVAAKLLQQQGARRVGILDLDSHVGNGTENILSKTESQHFVEHFSLGYQDVDQFNNSQWLSGFPHILEETFSDCDILLYQAGVDCHENDPFVDKGHFSTEQMLERDLAVFRFAKKQGIPVVTNLAGGYQTPLVNVLKLHDQTLLAFDQIYSE